MTLTIRFWLHIKNASPKHCKKHCSQLVGTGDIGRPVSASLRSVHVRNTIHIYAFTIHDTFSPFEACEPFRSQGLGFNQSLYTLRHKIKASVL